MTEVHRIRLIIVIAASIVTLAATRPQTQPASWTLDPRPSVTLGLDESDPAALLQTIVFATRLADGSILVGDRGEFALKLFAADGAFRRSFARKGSGPGEVRFLGRMFRCGDSVYTYDIEEGHRMSVFSLDGRYARTFRFRVPAGQRVPYLSACNARGDFVHVGWGAQSEMKGGIHRSNVPVWLSRGDSTAPRAIDSVPGSERWGQVHDNRIVGSRPLPLGKQPVVGIGRARAYVGSGDRFQVKVFDLTGKPLSVLQRTETAVAVSRADIRDEIERSVANGGEARRAQIERSYADITFPSTLPAYTHLMVDAEDHVWVRGFPRGASPTVRWTVFAPTGAPAAEVQLPAHLEVFEIGRDYVLGRYLDPTEAVPQVRLYRLTRVGARKP